MQILAALFLVFWSLPNVVKGNIVLRVLLNRGEPMATGEICNATEWNLINATITTLSQNQRRDLLRGNENKFANRKRMEDDPMNSGSHRDLATYPAYCKNTCQLFPPKRCLAVACKGYRRERITVRGLMGDAVNSNHPNTGGWSDRERDLFYSTSCSNQKSEMKNWLNNLAYQVSFNCSKLLRAPRNMTCFDDSLC